MDQNTPAPQDGELRFLWKTRGFGASGCPALYEETRGGERGYVVQGLILTEGERAQMHQVADGEDGVWVPADVVENIRTLGVTEGQPLTAALFGALIAGVEHTAFRLELQPGYSEPGEAALFDAFLQGERPYPPDLDPELADWYEQIARQTAAGIRVARVRVQQDPPTAYQEFERWLDRWNTGAGEDIRYLTRADAHEIGLLPAAGNSDWWLLDSCRLIVMLFDDEGRRIGDILTEDPGEVIKACRWRDLATHYSTPVTLPGVAA